MARLGLEKVVDAAIFCADVGWRKPAGPIFERVLEILGVQPEDCLLVGDDPRWDLTGPRALGMKALMLVREGGNFSGEQTISSLQELWTRLE